MRYYSSDYADTLNSSISAAINSVDSTSYSTAINNVDVKLNRCMLKASCISAATSAIGNVNQIKEKLEDLQTTMSKFYSDVDGVSESVYETASTIVSTITPLNTALSELCNRVAESGQYHGVTVTPAGIANVSENLTKASDELVKYYAKSFLNADGSINQDAVNKYFDDYDLLVKDGTANNLANSYRTNGLILTTESYLLANNYEDQAYTDLTNIFMTAMLEQDNTVMPAIDEAQFYTYDGNGTETRLAYMTYKFKDSATYFTDYYSLTLQNRYAACGYTSDYVDEKFAKNLQMSNILTTLAERGDYLTVPVELTREFCLDSKNQVDPEYYDLNQSSSMALKVPFPANFVIENLDEKDIKDTITNSNVKPDSAVKISYVCNTSLGPVTQCTFSDSETNCDIKTPTNIKTVSNIYVVTGDSSCAAVCDGYEHEFCVDYLKSNITEQTKWDYIGCYAPIIGPIGDMITSIGEDNPNNPMTIYKGINDYAASFSPYLAPVNALKDTSERLVNYYEIKEKNKSLTDSCNELDSWQRDQYMQTNTGAYGSYAIDDPTIPVEGDEEEQKSQLSGKFNMLDSMTNPREAQARLGYIQFTSGASECHPYDLDNYDTIEDLTKPSGDDFSTWRKNMEDYYSQTHNGETVDSLSNEEYRQYMESYNKTHRK